MIGGQSTPDAAHLAALGQRYAASGQLREALAVIERIDSANRTPSLYTTASTLCRELCEVEAARDALSRAHELSGRDSLLVRRALMLSPMMRTWAQIAADRDRSAAELSSLSERPTHVPDPALEVPNLDFYSAFHGEDELPHRRRLARMFRRASPSLLFSARHCTRPPRAGRSRPRVGFVSTHLCDHTIGRLNRGLIAGLTKSHETIAFFPGGIADSTGQQIAASASRSIVVPLDLEAARQQIADAELDVLCYPDIGMGSFTYFLAFARLAHVQCATWGHPVTTGVDGIDYFVSTAAEAPDADQHYSERLVRLPTPGITYDLPSLPDAPPDRSRFDLPDEAHLYVCPQSLFKLHPDQDPVWVEILRRDPRGLLILLEPRRAEWKTILLRRLSALDPAVAERIRFLPRMSRPDFVALLGVADVMLDSFHFGGGHTSLEALAMGTPVVTWPSRFLRGRLTLSWYQALGMEDCVVAGPDAFVDLAVRIATVPAIRMTLRDQIIARHARLFNDGRAVTEHEQLFARALQVAGARAPATR